MWAGTVLVSLITASALQAANVSWNQTSVGNNSFSLSGGPRVRHGLPAAVGPSNGDNVFIIWTGGSGTKSQTDTNSTTDIFNVNTLTITNNSGDKNAGQRFINLTFNGQTFLTNSAAQVTLLFAGSTANSGGKNLFFNSNVTFVTGSFIGQAGNATMSFAGGTVSGGNFLFTASSGDNNLYISGNSSFGLTGTMTVTNVNVSNGSAGTISANATISRRPFSTTRRTAHSPSAVQP